MLTISLTTLPQHRRKELFWDKGLRVVSRSGLNPTEAALVAAMPSAGTATRPLFLGGRTGAAAMAAWLRGVTRGVATIHTFDAHAEETIRRNLANNHAAMAADAGAELGFLVSTSLDLVGLARGDAVFWQLTKGDGTAERDLFVLEQVATRAGRRLTVAAEEANPTFVERLRKVCGGKLALRKAGGVTLLQGTVSKPYAPEALPNHRATFEVSLKGHEPITLTTLPGCFCHRRADMGGLALTEVVAEQVAFDGGDRVLDMGCGCGMDGILLATAFPEKALRVDYLDTDACARESALENIRRHPHQARVFFHPEGLEEGAYDLFLSNPPYFGDWRIAKHFIQTAARTLRKGGLIAYVAKTAGKPTELLQAEGFTPLGTFQRRGYTVILAEK